MTTAKPPMDCCESCVCIDPHGWVATLADYKAAASTLETVCALIEIGIEEPDDPPDLAAAAEMGRAALARLRGTP